MDIKGVFKNFAKKIVDNITTTEKIKFKDSGIIGEGIRKIKPSVVEGIKKYPTLGAGAVATYYGGKAIGNKEAEEEYRKKVIEEILEGNKNNDRFTKRNKK
jgi:hypothetical protein